MADDKGQSPLENLRGKPKDQRVAIAQGAAAFVIVILFLGWTVYFFRKIQTGAQQINLESSAGQNDFNFTNVKDAQDQLKTIYGDITDDIRELRNQSQQVGSGAVQEMVIQEVGTSEIESMFTNPQ